MSETLDTLLGRLQGVRKSGRGFAARCPSHEDNAPSLSIRETDSGTLLVCCHAGCTVENIVRAIGLEMRDLFPPSGNGKAKSNGQAFASANRAVAALERKHGKRSGLWTYTDLGGNPVGVVVRWDKPDEKYYRPASLYPDGWHIEHMPAPRPLYRWPDLAASPRVVVCEGEKAADAACGIDFVATTSSGGAKAAHKTDWQPLAGKEVWILPDHDAAGERYAHDVAGILAKLTPEPSVRIVALPDLPDGGDIVDWLSAGGTVEQLYRLVEATPAYTAAKPPDGDDKEGEIVEEEEEKRQERLSQSTQLVNLALASQVALCHDAEQVAFASLPVHEHWETWPIRSSGFRLWLQRLFHRATEGRVPGGQALADAISTLEGRALFDSQLATVAVRLAEREESIYLDLADSDWRAVRIDATGWEIDPHPPVRFRRPRGLLALPQPQRGGNVEDLRRWCNVASDADWHLLVAWLLAAMRPRGPYPVLCLAGEQGAAKSTLARLLRLLVDPNKSPIRSPPRDSRYLMIAASNAWVLALDNLSKLEPWLSDCLCRLATGGGFSTRELYSDDEEKIFDAQRPVIVASIEDLASRGDLLDRALILHLPQIKEEDRKTEARLFAEFEAARPRLLGALLDVIAGALAHVASVKLDKSPRMADFAVWATAAEPALGWDKGAFMAAYEANRSVANEQVLEASPLTGPIRQLLDAEPSHRWEGTAASLLQTLTLSAGETITKQPDWPKKGHTLSGRLRRIAPNLRKSGIEVEFGRDTTIKRQRIITLTQLEQSRKTASNASRASNASKTPEKTEPSAGRSLDAPGRSPPKERPAQTPVNCRALDALDALDAPLRDFSNAGNDDSELF
jgi:hypothetical protein